MSVGLPPAPSRPTTLRSSRCAAPRSARYDPRLIDLDQKPGAAHVQYSGRRLDFHRARRAFDKIAGYDLYGPVFDLGEHVTRRAGRIEMKLPQEHLAVRPGRKRCLIVEHD